MNQAYTKEGNLIVPDQVERNNKLRHLKLSDTICPICHTKTVSRLMRQCTKCKQILLWSGDSIEYTLYQHNDFYMWYKSPSTLIEGWHHSSYFNVSPYNKHQSNVNEFYQQNNIKV
jgi:hypothetical protein